jgi:hypothetical protein
MKQEWLEATTNGDLRRIQELLANGADINALDNAAHEFVRAIAHCHMLV